MRTILSAPAWPYANGPRHIGHVSGFALPCDMFSRYQRMAGNRVLMVSCQVILGTFFLSILGIKHTRHPALVSAPSVPVDVADHREQQAAAPRL